MKHNETPEGRSVRLLRVGEQVRHVLSDWDALASPPRAEVLRLHDDGRVERLSLLQ